jgi:hypothetical protein
MSLNSNSRVPNVLIYFLSKFGYQRRELNDEDPGLKRNYVYGWEIPWSARSNFCC